MKDKIVIKALEDKSLVPFLKEELKSKGLPKHILLNSDVYINGLYLPSEKWETTTVLEGEVVEVYPNVHYVTSLAVAGLLYGAGAAATITSTILAGIANVFIGVAVSFALNWAMSKLFPVEQPASSTDSSETLPTITGANNAYRPYEQIPLIIGTTRTVPDFAVQYYSAIVNGAQEIRHLFCVGVGELDVWDIRKEDTPITDLTGIEYYIYSGWTGQAFKWFNTSVTPIQENFSTRDYAVYKATSPINTKSMGIILTFPNGLKNIFTSTNVNYTLYIFVNLKITNETTGQSFEYTKVIQNNNPNLSSFRGYVQQDFSTPDTWSIEVYTYAEYLGILVPCNNETYAENYYFICENSVSELQWFKDQEAVTYTGQSLTFIELKATASDTLTGGLNTINCMARLKGMQEDGTLVSSSNPSLLARRILKDKNIIDNTEYVVIDDASFSEFEAHCDKYGFTSNGEERSGRAIGEVLSDMLEIGQGYLSAASGVYEIFYDNPTQAIVDTINSRNSWGLTVSTEKAIKAVDGLKISFNNKDLDYQTDERLVHDNSVTPKNVQTLSNAFIDNADLAWKYGILNITMSQIRNQIFKFSTDWRSIDYRPGQKLLVQHPVFFYGIGTAGKVIDYLVNDTGGYEAVILDQLYSTDLGKQYILHSGTKYQYAVRFWDIKAVDNEETHTLYFSTPIYQESLLPNIGEILTFGETEKEGQEVLIRNITRNVDFTAEIECVTSDNRYYEALTGEIPPFESNLAFPNAWGSRKPYAPQIVSVERIREEATLDELNKIRTNAIMTLNYLEKDGVVFNNYLIGIKESASEMEYEYFTSTSKETFKFFDLYQGRNYSISVRAISTLGFESEIVNYDFTYNNITNAEYSISDFAATIDNPNGVKFTFTNSEYKNIKSYVISGAVQEEILSSPFTTNQLIKKTGELAFSIVAKDNLNLLSKTPATASIEVLAPLQPTPQISIESEGLMIEVGDSKTTWDIRHYAYKDLWTNTTHKGQEQFKVSPRSSGEYTFEVVAVDIFENESTKATLVLDIPEIEAPIPQIEIIGGVLRATWQGVNTYFPIDKYEISTLSGTILHTTKATFYDIEPNPTNTSGIIELRVRAFDTAGNASQYGILTYTVTKPSIPQVSVIVSTDKRNVVVSWIEPSSEMPVVNYDLVRQYSIGGQSFEVEYGTFDTSTTNIEPLPSNVDDLTHILLVRARNALGQTSDWGEADINIFNPSRVSIKPTSIDNNVLLYWTAPTTNMFEILEYEIYDIDTARTGVIRTKADTLFSSFFEEKAGVFTYGIVPVDLAGNKGQMSTVSVTVDQPPDFEVFSDIDNNTFEGIISNGLRIDGLGLFLGYSTDTWEENIARTGIANVTWQDKIDNEMPLFLSPYLDNGEYSQTVDIGTVIASTNIVVTVDYEVMEGNPEIILSISTSLDGENFTVISTGSFSVYATNFRYVKYEFSLSSGAVLVENINYTLKVKQKSESGVANYNSADGTAGTEVLFTTGFIDVKGTPITSVVGNKPEGEGTYPYSSYVIFEDIQAPTGFRVFVLDKNGNPATAQVAWQVNGV